MPRIRTIKPEMWTSEQFVGLSSWARLFFIGMLNFVDDEGWHTFTPKSLRLRILPNDFICPFLLVYELLDCGLLGLNECENDYAITILNFSKHQRVSHACPSDLKSTSRGFVNHREGSGRFQSPPQGRERKGTEGNGREGDGRTKYEDILRLLARSGVWKNKPDDYDWLDNLHDDFPTIDILRSAGAWATWVPDADKKPKNFRLSFRNWVERDCDWGRNPIGEEAWWSTL